MSDPDPSGIFSFPNQAPNTRVPRRKRLAASANVPIWGTFLILLVVFVGGSIWGGWRLLDRYDRQHREAEEIRRIWYESAPSRRMTAEESLAVYRVLVEEAEREQPRHPLLPKLLAAFHKYERIVQREDMDEGARMRQLDSCGQEMHDLLHKIEIDLPRALIEQMKKEQADQQRETGDDLREKFKFK